jgi:serine/threonine protein kinase
VLRCTACLRGVSTLHTDASGTAPPDAFGPFRVLHQIGAGVLGPVFRAYQPDPGRLVAVKLFRLDVPPDIVHRLIAALDRLILADLTHMGIAAPLAAGMSDASAFLAMDFVAAESFDVVVRDYGPAPVAESLRVATQLGGALDFAAAVGVYHGALHPRDVLVSTDDTRVTGLGIAQALEQVGLTPPVRRPYTAPERVAGAAWDRRADVFSLAALVYEMLCGRRIAGLGREAANAMPQIAGADVRALRDVFARALAENPDERDATALGFVEALHGVFQPASEADAAPPRRRRRDTDSPSRRSSRSASRAPLPLADDALPLERAAEEPTGPAPEAPRALDIPVVSPEPREEPPVVAADAMPPAGSPEPDATDAAPAPGEPAMTLGADHREPLDVQQDLSGPARFDDLDLRRAEAERYEFAESPAFAEAAIDGREFAAESDDRRDADNGQAASFDRSGDLEGRGRAAVDRPAARPEPEPAATTASPVPVSVTADERRSGIWPIALALIVGLLVGFAFGFGVGTRDRAGAAVADAEPATTRPADTRSPGGAQEAATRVAPEATPPAPSPADAPREVTPPAVRPPSAAAASPAAERDRQPPTRAAEAGRLLVRSTPAGARVTVDGRDVGTTPLTVRDLARGSHSVRVAHQGYVTAERRVRISTAQPAQSIAIDLVATRPRREVAAPPAAPERVSGSLMIDSRPAGARVFVDGKLVGTTPLLLDPVGAGDHGVRLELDGHSPWTTTTRVTGGERVRVSGSLEPR